MSSPIMLAMRIYAFNNVFSPPALKINLSSSCVIPWIALSQRSSGICIQKAATEPVAILRIGFGKRFTTGLRRQTISLKLCLQANMRGATQLNLR